MSQQYAVMLPCQPEDFREFIEGLLGKPQVITGYVPGPFEVTQQDIQNLFHLVVQRVRQQNEGTLIQFTVRIVYDDSSSVLLNTLEDFVHYTEVRPIVSVGAYLTWIFLVQFQDKRVPEKQQIDVSIISESGGVRVVHHNRAYARQSFYPGLQVEGIAFSVSHTARTWGADIEAMLVGQINTLIKKTHPMKDFINLHSSTIGLGVGTTVFGLMMTAAFYITQRFLGQRVAEASHAASEAKIDYLVKLIAAGVWPRFFFYVLCFVLFSLILSVTLGIWSGVAADTAAPSFLLLSKRAVERKEELLNKNKKGWRLFILSLVSGTVASVLGSIIFALFMQKWF